MFVTNLLRVASCFGGWSRVYSSDSEAIGVKCKTSCMSAVWSGHGGAAAGCHCRVLVKGNAVIMVCVRFGVVMPVPLQGAA